MSDTTTKTPRARLSGRGKKAGRINAMIRIKPENWAELKRQAQAAKLTTGELLERVFLAPS
jgi:DNA primase